MTNISEHNLVSTSDLSIKEVALKIKVAIFYLKQRIIFILFTSIIFSFIGFSYSFFFKKVMYTAELTFVLEDGQGGNKLSGAMGLAASLGLDLGSSGGGAFTEANIIELLKSRRMIEKALLLPVGTSSTTMADQFIQIKKWEVDKINNTNNKSIVFFQTTTKERLGFTRQQDSLLNKIYLNLRENIKVGLIDKKMSILKISVNFENESFTKDFLNNLANVTSEFYIETKSKKSRQNVQILERQVDSIRKELNAAIMGTAIESDFTFNLNPALNVKRTPVQKRQIDIQANTAILTELVKNLEISRLTLRKETPLFQIIDYPILPLKISGQKKITNSILGFLIGLSVAIGYLLCKRYFFNIIN